MVFVNTRTPSPSMKRIEHVASPRRLRARAQAWSRTPTATGTKTRRSDWLDRQVGGLSLYQALRPIAIGIVHGLAGSAAVALLVLTQIREPLWAVAYLLLFGAGTTAGMMLMTSVIALPFVGTRQRPLLNLGLQVVAGALSLGLGCWMAWKLGVSDGLFVAVA